jgi:hypothetical protein
MESQFMNNADKKKLETLLIYWVKHNEEHAKEFKEWAKKAGDAGQNSVQDNILQAVQRMSESNEFLFKAMKALKA